MILPVLVTSNSISAFKSAFKSALRFSNSSLTNVPNKHVHLHLFKMNKPEKINALHDALVPFLT